MFKRKIYLGISPRGTVYYDKKSKDAIIAKKSVLHSSEKQIKRSNIAYVLFILIILSTFIKFVPIKIAFSGKWTVETLYYLVLLWFIEAFVLIYVTHKALFDNITVSSCATRENFEGALVNNKYWDKFCVNGNVSWRNFIEIYIGRILITLCNPAIIFIFYKVNQAGNLIGTPINSSIFMLSLFGIIPGVTWIMWFENNPATWLHIVRKYQQGKLNVNFAEERKEKNVY
ncbi:hypothetical protein [Streptococcus loxodontisalivarius]|uniref:Uncharacterized protein n=1 Tax=Streptococcus loxodontisalivarius TaxID=1349415 RepID=A0ABS2PV38_9STRE|nr:hypothetical protein [Streptococcus loxodontisalivarius]MBM7643796.1 hypothetical protein [Streptococcus loxodontisalivarius]